MISAYTTFGGRSRPDLKKLPALKLPAVGKLTIQAENMFTFAGIYIQRARELAKDGQKDAARDWYRFFNNSRVIEFLRENAPNCNVGALAEDLGFLGLECHPLDVPDFSTDLQSIRNCLTEILSHVKKAPKNRNVRRSGFGRIENRKYGNR